MEWKEVGKELLMRMRTFNSTKQMDKRHTQQTSPYGSTSTLAHLAPAQLVSQLRVMADGRLAVNVGTPLQVALNKQRLMWKPTMTSPLSAHSGPSAMDSSFSRPSRTPNDYRQHQDCAGGRVGHNLGGGEGERCDEGKGEGEDEHGDEGDVPSGTETDNVSDWEVEGGIGDRNGDGHGSVSMSMSASSNGESPAVETRSEQQIHARTLAELSQRIGWLQQQPRCAEVLCQQLYTHLCLQANHGGSVLAQLEARPQSQSPSQQLAAAASFSSPSPSLSDSAPHTPSQSHHSHPASLFLQSPQEGNNRSGAQASSAHTTPNATPHGRASIFVSASLSPSKSMSSPLVQMMLATVQDLKFYVGRDQNKDEEVHKLLHEIERRLHQYPLPLKPLLDDSKKLQSLLMLFDVHELGRLLAEQESCVKQLEGEEIVMLIGFTGCGKSTTIHWLAGSKMERWIESNGKPHIGPTHVINPAAEQVFSSSASESVTRYLHAVPVSQKALGGVSPKTLVLVDAPGLMDSRNANNPEVDCANSIGIVEAMQHCKSVRPLIFLQDADVTDKRGAGVRQLVHMLSDMLHNVEDTAPMLSFVFTKWSVPGEPHATVARLKEHIGICVEDAYNKSSNDPNKAFLTVLEHAVMATENGSATVIEPLSSKQEACRFIRELTRRTPIQDPRDAFRFFITATSSAKIQEQCSILHKGVRQSIELDDMPVACFRLQQLAVLRDRCKQGQAESALRESEEHVRSWLQRTFKHGQQLVQTLSNAAIWSKYDIESVVRDANLLHQADPLAEIIGEKGHARPQALMQDTVKLGPKDGNVQQALMRKTEEGMERAVQLLNNSLLLRDVCIKHADVAFQPYLDQLSLRYSLPASELVSVIYGWLDELAAAAARPDLKAFTNTADQIINAIHRTAAHPPNQETDKITGAMNSTKAALLVTLDALINESAAWLKSIQHKAQYAQLCELATLLETASVSPSLHIHIDPDAIISKLAHFQQQCVSHFHTREVAINDAIGFHPAAPVPDGRANQRRQGQEQEQEHDEQQHKHKGEGSHEAEVQSSHLSPTAADSKVHELERMGPFVLEMQQIREIPTIGVLVTEKYHACAQRVLAVVRTARDDAEKLLAALREPASSSNSVQSYERFVKSVHVLQQARWVESLEAGACENVLKELFHGISQHVQIVCARVGKLDLSVEHGKLRTALDIRAQVLMMQPLSDLIPGFAKQYSAMVQGFEAGTKQALEKIDQTFNLRHVSIGAVQERLAYLQRLRIEYEQSHPSSIYLAEHKIEDEDKLHRDIEDAKAALAAHEDSTRKVAEALQQEIDSLYDLQRELVQSRKEHSQRKKGKGSSSWGVGAVMAATKNALSGALSPLDQRIHAALQTFHLASVPALDQRLTATEAKQEQHQEEAAMKASELSGRVEELNSMLQQYEALKHTEGPSERQVLMLQQSGHQTLKRLETDIEETQQRLDEFTRMGTKYALPPNVDLHFAEQSLEYMDALKDGIAEMVELSNWLGDLTQHTADYLQHYGNDFLRDELRRNYEQVINPEAQDSSYRHVFNMAQQVMIRVKDIQLVEECHHLSRLLQPKERMAWLVDKLNEQLEHMQTYMEQVASQKRTPELELQLTIAKSLAQFDPIHKRTDVTFAGLHQQHRMHLLDNNKTALSTALNAIQAHNFSLMRAELNSVSGSVIKGQSDYVLEQVRHPVSTSVQHLMSDCRSKIAVLMIPMTNQINSIEEINQKLSVIRSAHTFVLEFMNLSTQEELKQFVDNECDRSANAMLTAKLQQWTDFIRRTIDASNFELAESQIKLLQTVCQLLSGNLGNLHESAETVRASMQGALDARVKRIAAMSLKELLVEQPMQFLLNLQKIASADGLYRSSLEDVKRAIQKTFKETLNKWSPQNQDDEQEEEAEEEDVAPEQGNEQGSSSASGSASVSSSSKHRRSKSNAPTRTMQNWTREKNLLRAVLRALPEYLHSPLQLELDNVEADLKDHWDNSQTEMQTALACSDWKEIRRLFQGYKTMGNHQLSNALQDGVRRATEDLKTQIDTTLDNIQSDVTKMYDQLQEYISRLQTIDTELGLQMPMVRAQLSKVQQRVTGAFTASCTEIRRILQHQGHTETLVPAVCRQLDCHTDVFVTFLSSVQSESIPLYEGMDSESPTRSSSSCSSPRLLQSAVQGDSASMILDLLRSYLSLRAASAKSTLTTRPLQVRVLKDLLACAKVLDAFYSKLKPLSLGIQSASLSVTSHSSNNLVDLIEHEDYRYRHIQASATAALRTMASSVREEAAKDLPHGVELQEDLLQRAYTTLQQHLTTLGEAGLLKDHVELPEEDQLPALTKAINTRVKNAIDSACRLENKENLTHTDYDLLRRSRAFLSAFSKHVVQADIDVKSAVDRLDSTWVIKVERVLKQVQSSTSASTLAGALVIAKRMAMQLTWLKASLDGVIDTFLSKLQERTKISAPNTLSLVAVELEQTQAGATLLETHSIFQGYFAKLMLKKVESQDIHYTLHTTNLRGDDIDTAALSAKFIAFDQAYKAAIKQYYFGKDDISMLVQSIRTIAAETGGQSSASTIVRRSRGGRAQTQTPIQAWWTLKLRQVIPQLLGQLFALWSYRRAENLSESERASTCLYQPLAPQVVAILRLLCLDQGPNSPSRGLFRNNVSQVSTGEGKSLINAMVAMVLALLGADVSIACYSSYLSHRDEKDFAAMFAELGAKDRIHYGTFEQVCERMVNEGENVRTSVEKMILDSAQSTTLASSSFSFSSSSTSSRIPSSTSFLRILVIDEIDVFFNERFYGNLYTPWS